MGVLAGLLVSACTPEIHRFAKSEWQDIKTFEYGKTLGAFVGIEHIVLTDEQRMAEVDGKLCLHEESENRTLTVNGVNDQLYYRHCTLQPYGALTPQRF